MTDRREVTIAVDAMGGDIGPEINIRGALDALADSSSLKVKLVGQESILLSTLKKLGGSLSSRLEVVHAEEAISMDDHAASAIRRKKNSSIHVGLRLQLEKQADAFISAGNSGAVMGGALLVLGRLSDVERPAIVVKLPTIRGFTVVLDAGANVDCKPAHLVQFAQMGSLYSEIIDGKTDPRVSLLSNASESHKGNELTRETHVLLEELKEINYVGYIEGRELFRGESDVIVCDGFIGNILLKSTEGLADSCFEWFRQEIKKDIFGIAGVLLMRKVIKKFKNLFDYQPYGAAPLLGIDGMVLISHGSSTSLAIKNGILTAQRGVEQDFISKISKRLESQKKLATEISGQ